MSESTFANGTTRDGENKRSVALNLCATSNLGARAAKHNRDRMYFQRRAWRRCKRSHQNTSKYPFLSAMPHPPQRIARSLTRFGRPPAPTRPLKRNWRTRLPIPHTPVVGREMSSCRLEEHYHATLADNAMYMTYIHESGPRAPPRDIRLKYDPANPYARFRRNPQVGGDKMGTKPPPVDEPGNVVRLEKVVLHSFQKQAIGSRASLLGLVMAMRVLSGETDKGAGRHGVSGVQLVHGKKSVGGWIRPGIPVGVKVELRGAPMYDFIAQLTEFVLPRLKDFGGVVLPPAGASTRSPSAVGGVVSMGLPPAAMQYFPQIEVNVDAYPKMYGMHIHFVTNATGTGAENRARALVSGLQVPFTRRS